MTRGATTERGSTSARGYGRAHRELRAQWKREIVDQGRGWCCEPVCLKPSRWISPDEPWHLAHTDDGARAKGVSHAECNMGDGGRRSWGRGIAARRVGRTPEPKAEANRWRPSRLW